MHFAFKVYFSSCAAICELEIPELAFRREMVSISHQTRTRFGEGFLLSCVLCTKMHFQELFSDRPAAVLNEQSRNALGCTSLRDPQAGTNST